MIDDDQIYVVVDIEADGPVPGLYSMLSIGAVATTKDEEVSSFYAKLQPIAGANQFLKTMEWWDSQPEAWQEVIRDAKPAEQAIKDFYGWLNHLDRKPVFVAHPVGYDYAFVSWYLWKYVQVNPFADERGASITLDLSSFIAGKYSRTLLCSFRSELPDWMKVGMPEHTHNALDDARGFGVILRNILQKTSY